MDDTKRAILMIYHLVSRIKHLVLFAPALDDHEFV
jgi:hypothetical protein